MISVQISLIILTSSLLRTKISCKISRPEGGIEPLRLSAPTGLKPATRTTECHLDNSRGKTGLSKVTIWSHNRCHGKKDDDGVTNGSKCLTLTRGQSPITVLGPAVSAGLSTLCITAARWR